MFVTNEGAIMSIMNMSFKERSLLFAKLAFISYNNAKQVKSQAKKLGFIHLFRVISVI